MNLSSKLKLCILGNAILLSVIILVVCIFDSGDDTYFRIGPSQNLVVISVKIDTWQKYSWLALFITFIKISQCIISEIAHPIIGFNIYNPDKTTITEFGKKELQVYGNSMYLIDSIREVFILVVAVTQIDLALIGVVAGEITSLFTIRKLLNDKTFTKESPCDEDQYIELVGLTAGSRNQVRVSDN